MSSHHRLNKTDKPCIEPGNERLTEMSDFEPFMKLADRLSKLHEQALSVYEPLVEGIIRSKSRDVRTIQHALDGLLGFCSNSRVLEVFRRLCRYYWDIDPIATEEYVLFYRDMWDSEDDNDLVPVSGKFSGDSTEGGKP